MIDFRYHLVSIVSIFLALAVGIALGAGPLKGTLGDTINQEITSLRQDKADLKTQLDASKQAAERRDAFIDASNRQLLAGRLGGATVALVVLPGAPNSLVKATTATLTLAGAKVGATVIVKNAWVDPKSADTRNRLADTLLRSLALDPTTDTQLPPLARALAAALQPAAPENPDAATVADTLKRLADAKLVSYSPDPVSPATSTVVISSDVSGGTTAENTATATAYAALANALDRAGRGTVLIGAEPTSGPPGADVSVVATARAQTEVARDVSTVDDAGISMGQASVVFALLEQLTGVAGHYGLGRDAAAPYAPLAGS